MRKPLSSGSCCRRAVRMPSVASSTRVSRGEPALEPHVPADLASERPALLVGDPPRHRARRDAPRLQHDHRPVGRQRRRHPRRLSGARRGRQDQRPPRAHRGQDLGNIRVDGGAVTARSYLTTATRPTGGRRVTEDAEVRALTQRVSEVAQRFAEQFIFLNEKTVCSAHCRVLCETLRPVLSPPRTRGLKPSAVGPSPSNGGCAPDV